MFRSRLFSKKLFYNVYLITPLLIFVVSSSCKPQATQNKDYSEKPLNQSFDWLTKYYDTHLYQLSSDSLIYYADSIFKYSYLMDTTGTDSNGLMIKLLEQALKRDQSSKEAADQLFSLYAIKKQYEKSIEVSEKYLNDTSDILHLFYKSILYYKIGDKGKADSGFTFVRKRLEMIIRDNPNPNKANYLGNMHVLSLILFIQDGKEKALLNFKSVIDRYPDDKDLNELYEEIEGYKNINDLIETNLP